MKRILVTGGAGYIGGTFANLMVDNNFKVSVIDDLSTGKKKYLPKKCLFKKIDITNKKKLDIFFKKKKFDAVFHFAAKLSVPESEKFPLKYFKNNFVGTKNLLECMQKYKIKNIIFSSTCAVYGETIDNGAVTEKSFKLPKSYYGHTKLMSENLIKSFCTKFSINFAILRYFNVIGAEKKLRSGPCGIGSLFKNISKNALIKRKIINVYGKKYNTPDGTCIRDYIDVNDLSELHFLSYKYISKKKDLILNLGYNKPLSVMEIIKSFENIISSPFKIYIKDKRKGDVEKIYCNNLKLKKIFPKWKAKYALEDSIISSINWERKINAKF